MTRRARSPTAISVFSGAGGLDHGLDAGGFEVRAAVELDPIRVGTIRANRHRFRNPRLAIIQADVSETPTAALLAAAGLRIGELGLLAGGPPCQSFSTAGKRQALLDRRGGLVLEYVRLVREAR